MAFYGLALAKRRPFRASVLIGTGIGISFMSTGLSAAAISLITALILPLFFKAWRSKSYAYRPGIGRHICSAMDLSMAIFSLAYLTGDAS